jgi:hypothetical protein
MAPQLYNLTSPPASTSGSSQHFMYDPKIISRLNQSNPLNDQNYCPNTLQSPTGYDMTDRINHNTHHYGQPQRHNGQHTHTSGGLGGYWMLGENNEKIWCPVDSNRLSKAHNPHVKLQRNATSVSQYKAG